MIGETNRKNFRSFVVERKVMKNARDNDFPFVNEFEERAAKLDASVYANLSVVSVDIIHKAEAVQLLTENPRLKIDYVKDAVARRREQRYRHFNDFLTFTLGETVEYDMGKGLYLLGATVIDDENILSGERTTVANDISHILDREVELPDVEFFVCLGSVDSHRPKAIDEILKFANERLPKTVDVYDVCTREAALKNPNYSAN